NFMLYTCIMILCSLICALALPKISSADQKLVAGWHKGAGQGKEMWAGVFRNNEGIAAYCADADLAPPWEGGSYRKDRHGIFQQQSGKKLSAEETEQLSYILKKWGDTTNDEQAAAVQLAIWSISTSNMKWGSIRL